MRLTTDKGKAGLQNKGPTVSAARVKERIPSCEGVARDLYGIEFRRGVAPCPLPQNHNNRDRNPSLRYDQKKDRIFCASQGCFDGDRGVDAFGLVKVLDQCDFPEALRKLADFYTVPEEPDRADRQRDKRILHTYDYRGQDGQLLFQVVRFEPKAFRQRQPDGAAGWTWNLDGVQRVLYRLPELLAAKKGQPVFICEGEKDVETLRDLGLLATCNPGGAGKWRPEYADYFRDRHAVLVPDHDDAGLGHMVQVARSLITTAPGVKIVTLPGLKDKGDASDWVELGHTKEELVDLTASSPTLTIDSLDSWEQEHRKGSEFSTPPTRSDEWSSPKPLSRSLPTVEPFDPELLPVMLRRFAGDVADRLQVPLDFPAATIVVALAGAIGQRAIIRPKVHQEWEVTPNLWGGIVARPGLMKSPCIRAVLKPLQTMQDEAMQEYKGTSEAHEGAIQRFEIGKTAWKTKATQAAKGGSDFNDFDQQPPAGPALTRYIVNDATLEKLHAILEENPQGVLYMRDELVGWLASLDRQGRESERPFFLEAWNGDGSYTIDRIGRGTLHVPHLCISVFGGIQPAKLERYLSDAIVGGPKDDGLAQRLQILVWPDHPTTWQNIDRPPDLMRELEVVDLFRRIGGMSPEKPQTYRFNSEAQQLFDHWQQELELRLRQESMPAVFESHLAKFRSLMPSLAVIFHICEQPTEPKVSLIQAQRAADFCIYLESHARRVYSCVVSPTGRASVLGKKLKAGILGVEFTVRDVYLKGWTGLKTPDDVRVVLGGLEDARWIRPIEPDSAARSGRPSARYEVNPEVYDGH